MVSVQSVISPWKSPKSTLASPQCFKTLAAERLETCIGLNGVCESYRHSMSHLVGHFKCERLDAGVHDMVVKDRRVQLCCKASASAMQLVSPIRWHREGPKSAVELQGLGERHAASVANTLASFAVPLHHSLTSMDLG